MALSEQAKEVIRQMKAGWNDRKAPDPNKDPRLAALEAGVADRGLSFYATKEQTTSPYVSPIRGSFAGFPKTLIEVGEYEILYDDSVMLTEKMKAEGVDVTLHVWEELFHFLHCFRCRRQTRYVRRLRTLQEVDGDRG